jgi:type VI protein secretion system component Hcp
MTVQQKQPGKQEKDPEAKRPHETIEDLEPEDKEGEAVKGGVSLSYEQIQWEYTKQKN